MKRKFGTRVKWFRENYWVSRGLPRGVSLRGNGGHEFFFFFFLDTAKRAISVRSWKRAVWIFTFLVSRSKLSYFQRFLKFLTRSRAQSFGFAKEKWEKYILRYPTLDIRAIHFSKIEEENEPDFQRYVEFLYKF